MRTVGAFSIPADHPCLPGHFPGRAVVPGVVLLDETMALIQAVFAPGTPVGLSNAKFLCPVLPDQIVTLSCARTAEGVAFSGAVAAQEVFRGSLRLGP